MSPFETPWTTAHQAPPSMGFSRQEYWSGVPLPSPNIALPPTKKTEIVKALLIFALIVMKRYLFRW